jgi:hypothetical protein
MPSKFTNREPAEQHTPATTSLLVIYRSGFDTLPIPASIISEISSISVNQRFRRSFPKMKCVRLNTSAFVNTAEIHSASYCISAAALPVDLPSMSYVNDKYDQFIINDLINDPVITDSYSPAISSG